MPDSPPRLFVYAGAYEARLVEVLAGDYPATRAWLTADAFHELAAEYVRVHPSRHPNLNRFGARFPAFLRRRRERVPAFAAQLARLELAITGAFDAPAAAILAPLPAGVAAVTMRTRLRMHPSLCLLRLPAAVVDWFEAWREGRAGGSGVAAPSANIDLLVVRTAERVMQRRLPRNAANVLRSLQRGRSLGRSLAGLAADAPVAEWFARWRAAGVFAAR